MTTAPALCACGAPVRHRAVKDWTFLTSPHGAILVARGLRAPPSSAPECVACHVARPEVVAWRRRRDAIELAEREAAASRWPHVRRVVDDVRVWRDWIECDAADPDGERLAEAERALMVSVDLLAAFDAARIREARS